MNPQTCQIEALEERRFFSWSLHVSFGGGDFCSGGSGFYFSSGGSFFGSSSGSTLFSSVNNLGLPMADLGLPKPSIGLAGSAITAKPFSLRGSYSGDATITGIGATPLQLDLGRLRRGTISTSIDLPALERSFKGRVPVTFLENRRFSFTLSQGSTYLNVAARLNKDLSITGSVTGKINAQRTDALFSVVKVTTAR